VRRTVDNVAGGRKGLGDERVTNCFFDKVLNFEIALKEGLPKYELG
jgi:hypothetical protein